MFKVFSQGTFWLGIRYFLFSNTSAGPGSVLGSQHAKSKESTKLTIESPDHSEYLQWNVATGCGDQTAKRAEDSLRWLGRGSYRIGYSPLLCQPIIDVYAFSNVVESSEMDHSHSLCLTDELQEQRNRS